MAERNVGTTLAIESPGTTEPTEEIERHQPDPANFLMSIRDNMAMSGAGAGRSQEFLR